MKSVFVVLSLIALNAQPARAAGGCLFGESIGEIENISRLSVKSLGKTVKMGRGHFMAEPIRVEVQVLKDRKTGKVYHMNATYEDQFDGGNTSGWIEDFESLELVANIGDGDIGDCTVR